MSMMAAFIGKTEKMNLGVSEQSFFARHRWLRWGVVAGLITLGVSLRLLALTNPPLDFHPLRQLRSAVVARGLYYQMTPALDPAERQLAISIWQAVPALEPSLVEGLTAMTYRLIGGEHLWVGRLYSILFWLVGAFFLFDLVRRLVSLDGAVVSLAVYLVLPFGIYASRSFQPDPLMVMWIILAMWALVRWQAQRRLHWALLLGLSGGMAALIKPWIGLMVGLPTLAVVLSEWGLRQAVRDVRVWLAAALMVAIPAAYYLVGLGGQASSGYFTFWTLGFRNLLTQPAFYVHWVNHLRTMFDFTLIIAALVGVALLPRPGRALAAGLWAGYVLFGLVMPEGIYTHDYYSLPLVPVIALCAAPTGSWLLSALARQPRFWRVVGVIGLVFALAYPAWIARSAIVGVDFRSEPATWTRIGSILPADRAVIALTQSDGVFLNYYGWRQVAIWPTQVDFELVRKRGGNLGADFNLFFEERTSGMDLFLVTYAGELEAQPELKAKLATFEVVTEGNGYILYDLHAVKDAAP
jgi:4-amino-4-deoxy-L-arabinose transferase-like glycosyltransferase